MLKAIINFANKLDEKMLTKEASIVDSLIEKIATDDDPTSLTIIEKEDSVDAPKDLSEYMQILEKHSKKISNSDDLEEAIEEMFDGFGNQELAMYFAEGFLLDQGRELFKELEMANLIKKRAEVYDFVDETSEQISSTAAAIAIAKNLFENSNDDEMIIFFKIAAKHLKSLFFENNGFDFESKYSLINYIKNTED